MLSIRPLFPLLILLSAAFAGCASDAPGATGDADLDGSDPAVSGPAGDGGSEAAEWYAFAFDREIKANTGGSGKIIQFAYTHTQVTDGSKIVLDITVDVLPTNTRSVCAVEVSFTGNETPEKECTELKVTELRHHLKVVQDDSGDREAGHTSTVTLAIPFDRVDEGSMFAWQFIGLAFEDGESSGSWEYYLNAEMRERQDAGTAFFIPYEQGESGGWWGFEFFGMTYGLSFFSDYVSGARSLSEESWNFGGVRFEVKRETLALGGYTFSGWRIATEVTSGEDKGGNLLVVAEELPMPVEFSMHSNSDGNAQEMSYRMTSVKLG